LIEVVLVNVKMKKISVLLTTYHEAFVVKGGGEYELLSVADGLRQYGIIADIYSPYARSLEFYDVVLHFSVHGGGLGLLRMLKNHGKPIVLWPNLWAEALSDTAISMIHEHVQLADCVAFKSRAETSNFTALINVPPEKRVLCKSVADSYYTKPSPRSLFQELYGVQDYALWMGIVEPSKNQLSVIGPLKDMGIPLVIVGKYRDKVYYDVCREAGKDHVIFIDSLPQRSEIVRSAFQNARFYVELSLEPAGLSALEAGLSGCRVLLSDSDWSREHFLDYAEFVDPLSFVSIMEGVERVLKRPAFNSKLQGHLSAYCFPSAMVPLVEVLKKVAG
jgi:hypothetical protein